MRRNTIGGRGVTRAVRRCGTWLVLACLVAGALEPGAVRGSASVAPRPTGALQTAPDNQGALYTLDGFGGVHPVGAAPSAPGSAYWPGWDIARGIVVRAGHQDGYVLDGFGGVHPFGAAPPLTATAYWRGWDIARGIALTPAGSGGWVLDGWGGLHAFGNAPTVTPSAYWRGWDIARGVVSDRSGAGGWVLDGFGGLHPFGDAGQLSGGGYWPGWDIARGLALTATGTGGYVLDGWGGVHAFGDAAPVTGSAYWRGWDIARAVVAWSAAPSGRPGGWVVDGWGAIHPFGSAPAEVPTAGWPGWDIVRGLGGGDNGGSRSYPGPTRHQCFAYTAAGSPTAMVAQAQALQSSPCAGISWTFPWSEIEPANGTFNWSFIDDALAASGSKPVILRVNPGLTSPAWVPRADGIVIPNPKGGTGWMPIPWNADFLAIWKTFIDAYGARYNANPNIAIIEGNGDGPQGEAHLTGTYAQWQAVGYSAQAYLGAIATEIAAFKGAFPSHKVSFAGATPPTGAPLAPNLLQGFISTCEQASIVIQNNGLTGTTYGHINQSIIEFGYQTASSLGTGLGAALRMATSLGASFVEVYYVDATNGANDSAISSFQT